MKKVFRNLFAALTAAALIGSFASCSDGDSGNDNEEQKVQPADKSKTETKTLKLEKNKYAATPQTQIKLNTGFDSLKEGDKVSVVLKGTADKALGKAEIIVCDTTKAANYWKNLADPYSCEIGTEFDISAEFTITENPVGSGAESMTLAINGLEDDKTVTLTCTKYLVQKGGLDTIAKEPEAKEPEVKEPVVEAETKVKAVEVWTGSQTIDWGDKGVVIDHAKFTADFTALRITYNATAGALKMAVCDPWTEIAAEKVSAGSSIADDGAINLATGDAQTVTITLKADAVAGIKGQGKDGAWGGVKIFGADTITITKVEAVAE